MPITTQGSFRIRDKDGNMPQFEVNNPYHSQGLAAGGSALLDAINRGKVHLAKFILDAGESNVVNTRDFKGKTSLIRACYIKAMLDQLPARTDLIDAKKTRLIKIPQEYPECASISWVRLAANDKEEKTRGKAIELLLQKDADVNCQDDVGRTALSYATEMRANDVVRILVKHNVDPDIADDKGNTPLIYSAMVGNDMAIEVLIRSFRRLGLNVDHINNEGLTALLIAAKNGFTECASILALDGKACVSFRDREKGMNAEEWARAQGCTTPEVMPFSPQAALLGYKYSRVDDDLGAAGGSLSPNEDRPPRISPPGSARRRAGRSANRHLDLEDVSKRLEKVSCSSSGQGPGPMTKESKKVQTSPQAYEPLVRGRHKRSSLPTIKFSGFFSAYSHERRERKSSTHNTDSLSPDPDSNYHGGGDSPNLEEWRKGARRKSRDGSRSKSKSPCASAAHRKKSHDRSPELSAASAQEPPTDGLRRPSTNTTLASASKVDVELNSSGCEAAKGKD